MRLGTVRLDGSDQAAVITENGLVPMSSINAHLGRAWPMGLHELIERGLSAELLADARRTRRPRSIPNGQLSPHFTAIHARFSASA
jgi:hypothetical protein